MCVMGENAGAQQFGDAEGGRQLARENCAECHAIDNGTGASANPNAPTFKDLAKTPGMTSAALTVALQTAHRNERPTLCGKISKHRHFCRRSCAFVHVWLRRFIGHLLVGCGPANLRPPIAASV